MTSSIDEEIELMIKNLALDPHDSLIRQFLDTLNRHLLDYGPKGWSAFIYGSTLHGLASKLNPTTDVCVTNIYSSTTAQNPIITNDNMKAERTNISNNTDVGNLKRLASFLISSLGKKSYEFFNFSEVPVPFFTIHERFCSSNGKFNISVDNTLDVERSNLITEYLALNKRVKPFLFALKQFIKKEGIDNEKNGYPSSYVYVMMGLYFLMFVQDPPVITCLYPGTAIKGCNYPVCLSKSKEKVQGFEVTYHNCVNVDYYVAGTDPLRGSGMTIYGTFWASNNTKSVGNLLIEAFRWFSYSATILEPKSINSQSPSILEPGWKGDAMVFADAFDPKFNIAASCATRRVKIINQAFAHAYVMLKECDSFGKVLIEPDSFPRTDVVNIPEYTHGRAHVK